MLLLFLLLTSVSASCRNGGSLGSDGCECVDGYTGNHCQVSPPTFCRHKDQFVNLNTHVIVSNEVKDRCSSSESENCHRTPWSSTLEGMDVSVHVPDSLIGAQNPHLTLGCEEFECNVHHTLHPEKYCNGLSCDFDTLCCQEHEKCSDRTCPNLLKPYIFNWTDPPYAEKGKLCEVGCSNDSDCEGSLTCAVLSINSPDAYGCMSGYRDYYDQPTYTICIADIDQGVTQVNKGGTPASLPLQECQSDCDNDSECVGDLRCFQRDFGEDVPGCQRDNSIPITSDVCFDPTKNNVMRKVSSDNPRGSKKRCEYDCDSDNHCIGMLQCHQRSSGELTPGCYGIVHDTYDICYYPPDENVPTLPKQRPRAILGLCEGDCDNNDQCAGDLVCHQRSTGDYTPGCYTKDETSSDDYCVDPEFVSQTGYIHGYVGQTKADVYSTSIEFTDASFLDTCCILDELCIASSKSCFTSDHIKDTSCVGECSDGDFNGNGQSGAHTCCHPMSWNCNSVFCPTGYLKNTKFCGDVCDDDNQITPPARSSQTVYKELTGTGVECVKTQKAASTREECANVCGEYYQMDNGQCYCTDTGPCESDTHAVTYKQRTYFERNPSHCCDLDPAYEMCDWKDCPERYDRSDGLFYSSDHTSECCVKRSDTHYCDTYNNNEEFPCPQGSGLSVVNYCGETCTEDKCCTPNNHFCANITCVNARPTGMHYCDGKCTDPMCCTPNNHFCVSITCDGTNPTGKVQCEGVCTDVLCCKQKPNCDLNHVCPNTHIIDSNYKCSEVTGVDCALSEYDGDDKCCIPKETCEEAYTRLNIEYSDRCYTSNYYDSNWNYKKLNSIVDISGFHRECCKPSCRQLMYERYKGGRGEDTCGDTDAYGTYSWNYDDSEQSNPSATVDNKDWVRKNCCENSCVKYAADNSIQCPGSMSEVYRYTSTLTYRDVTLSNAAEFQEHCCTYNCQGMYDSDSRCSEGYMRNEKHNPTEWSSWQRDRSEAITDFDSTCCVPKECHNVAFGNYVDSPGTCGSLYGASFMDSKYYTVVSHKAECCEIGDCKSAIIGGLTCDNGYFGGAVSGVTSANAASKCCTDTCANRNYDCGDKYKSANYNVGLPIEQFDNDMESICCSDKWNCGAEAGVYDCQDPGSSYCCIDPSRSCKFWSSRSGWVDYIVETINIDGETYDTTMLEYSGDYPSERSEYQLKCRCMYYFDYDDECPLMERMRIQFRL